MLSEWKNIWPGYIYSRPFSVISTKLSCALLAEFGVLFGPSGVLLYRWFGQAPSIDCVIYFPMMWWINRIGKPLMKLRWAYTNPDDILDNNDNKIICSSELIAPFLRLDGKSSFRQRKKAAKSRRKAFQLWFFINREKGENWILPATIKSDKRL